MNPPNMSRPEYVLVDCLDSRGRVQLRQRVALPEGRRTFTIGRSVVADVTLDDEHSAPLHATIEVTADGSLLASDLGSVNGIIVDGKRRHAVSGLRLEDGGTFQIGRTPLRIRTSRQHLAPEKPDQLGAKLGAASWLDLQHPERLAGAGAAIVGAQSIYEAWLGAPRDMLGGIITSIGFAVLLVGAWVAVWALLSRVMQEEWRWLRHAAIILGVSAVTVALNGLLDLGWFAFSLPPWSGRGTWIGALALAAAVSLHLMHASGLSSKRAALIGCLFPALLAGGGQWMLSRNTNRDVNHISADLRLYPPSLRLRKAGSSDEFFAGGAALRKTADAKLKATPAEDADTYE
jgi:pSer/pThr/pTyr-binding forkhead associated (FHA) protein